MAIESSAGIFKLVCFNDGSPNWVNIYRGDMEIMCIRSNGSSQHLGVTVDDLKDLIYAASRMIEKVPNARS